VFTKDYALYETIISVVGGGAELEIQISSAHNNILVFKVSWYCTTQIAMSSPTRCYVTKNKSPQNY